ncbi:MAG: glycerol kinase GlpK [Candidatus Melainabacteria bacterium]|nr:glycerol kinase GlpK [Candidatus Melainabacteria bacterium]
MQKEKKYILSLDQGTTSSRTLLIDETSKLVVKQQKEFKQIFPNPSWVEHNPEEIWNTQLETATKVISENNIDPKNILGIAITNQRETIVAFDSKTGKPVYNAIVWQCRRTAKYCNEIKLKYKKIIKEKTGLEIDPYFSASKMRWLLDNVQGIKELVSEKRIRFGTIDSWLIWKLTDGRSFYTDSSNASRTMLFNINENKYDKELLNVFGIEEWMLPKVIGSNGDFGYSDKKYFGTEIPIKAVLGDQQAALFGQCCFKEGDLKVTYGTGGFLLVNLGEKAVFSENFLTTIAWDIKNCKGFTGKNPTYALEGSTFISGAIIQWLRDELGLIKDSSEAEKIAISINSNEGVYLVPALVGLGAPYWNENARGTIIGITRGTTRAHIIRAALESMAYQITDLILPVKNKLPKDIFVKADGGAAKNNFLMQFQADLLQMPVTRSSQVEATGLGVAYLAGLSLGIWSSKEEIQKFWHPDELFLPKVSRDNEYNKWKEAVKRSLNWEN